MADDDVEAMLEEALVKDVKKEDEKNGTVKSEDKGGSEENESSSKKKKKKRNRSKSKERKRSKSRERKSSKKRSRSRKRSKDRKKDRSRSREKKRSRSRDRWAGRDFRRDRYSPPRRGRGPQHSPSPDRTLTSGGRRLPGPERRDVMPFTPRRSPPRGAQKDMSPEERDARTVFIMQLSHKTRPRDLEDFFSSVGRVRDVRIITDSKTRRSKGIGYVEFWDLDSVPLAIALNGQRLLGAPLSIQQTQAEKNRAAGVGMPVFQDTNKGPLKVYVGSLHFNITEEMLKGIFEPFGFIEQLQLMKDTETDRSRGYGFVVFRNYDDGKRSIEQLNGFELAGRPIKVGHVTDHTPAATIRSLDTDEMDRAGVDLGTSGRMQLMAKLAEGTGLKLPSQAEQMLMMDQNVAQQNVLPNIATQCFMLSNMFDPSQETESDWADDIRDDVIEECSKHGGVLHIFVDKQSPNGNVYVKCPSVAAAAASVHALHGRWFAGKVITGNFVPVNSYHNMFKEAQYCTSLIAPAFQPSNEKAI